MERLEKNDLRQEYIIPALDAFKSIMDEGVTCGPFWNEVSNHPEYPTSKVFTWLYDNGESYEDYREYKEHKFYSTLQIASEYFWASVVDDYEGKYVLTEWELDTQEKSILEESAWIKCKPYYNEEWQGDYEPDYEEDFLSKWEDDHYWNGEPKYPERSIEDAWEFIDWFENPDNPSIMKETSYLEEIELERDWLSHEGTNYQEWKECEEEIKKRKSDILCEELNNMLVELLTIK